MKRLVMAVCLLVPVAAFAAGGGGGGVSRQASPPSLQEIKKKINDRKYREAIPLLNSYLENQPRNADAWNYLGFAYRKTDQLPAASMAYEKALAIDPKHLGAHEYLGEAYLMKGEPETAKAMLGKLKVLCGNCEEYRDLDQAIKAYRPKK